MAMADGALDTRHGLAGEGSSEALQCLHWPVGTTVQGTVEGTGVVAS